MTIKSMEQTLKRHASDRRDNNRPAVVVNLDDGSETIVIEGLLRARPGMKVTPEAVTLPPVAGQEG